HLPHRLADQGAGQRRGHDAPGRGQAVHQRPGRRVPARVPEDDGRGATRGRRGLRRRARTAPDHDPRPADPHRRHRLRVRHRAGPLGRGRHPGLVLRRSGRADGGDRPAHGRAAVRRPAGRALRLRLRDGHPGRAGRARIRSLARRLPPYAHLRAVEDAGHALLPAALQTRSPRGRLLRPGRRHDRARAGPGRHGRPGRVRGRPAQGVLRRRGPRLHRERLRAFPPDAPERRRAGRRAAALPEDRRAHDHGPHRRALRPAGRGFRAGLYGGDGPGRPRTAGLPGRVRLGRRVPLTLLGGSPRGAGGGLPHTAQPGRHDRRPRQTARAGVPGDRGRRTPRPRSGFLIRGDAMPPEPRAHVFTATPRPVGRVAVLLAGAYAFLAACAALGEDQAETNAVTLPPLEPGVSLELARHRTATLRGVAYELVLEVRDSTRAPGSVTITLERHGGADDLVLDFRGLELGTVRVD